jgi:hypothetical protein
VNPVVRTGGGTVVEGVEDPNGVGRRHLVANLVSSKPSDATGLGSRRRLTGYGPTAEDEGDDSARPAVKAAGLPHGFGLRDLRHYFATVLIFGGANVKSVQLAMGHTTPTITLNTYVGYWPDAVDQTRTLVDSALGCTGVVPARVE